MKKSLILLFSLISACTVCFAGCQTKNEKSRAVPRETQPPVTEELPADDAAENPHCDGMPNVRFKHRNGVAVDYGKCDGCEIVIIHFGRERCDRDEEDPAERQPHRDDRTPAEPNN